MFNQQKIHRIIAMFCIGINEILGILYSDMLLNKGELLSNDGVDCLKCLSKFLAFANYLPILLLAELFLTQFIHDTVMIVSNLLR